MLIAINLLNLFISFKYIKHYHLGQMFKNIFQSNLRIKIMNNSSFENKITIPIINQEHNIMNKYHLTT